jgi:hypothetical protein
MFTNCVHQNAEQVHFMKGEKICSVSRPAGRVSLEKFEACEQNMFYSENIYKHV